MTSDSPESRAIARPAWSVLRERLDAQGFRPTKTLGQNFLLDPNACRSIAADAGLDPGARVLEIGAGCGFLTQALLERGLEVLALEIDARLVAVARGWLGERDGLRWCLGDALAGKNALSPRLLAELPARDPWHVVANMPYSIAAPLLVLLARVPNPPLSLTVLVQSEVALRIAAAPGTPEWGALSARLALACRARLGRTVGAQLFWPRPRVASRVVHLERQPSTASPAEVDAYDRLVDALFQRRRKQLGTSLGAAVGREAAQRLLAEVGIDPRTRPEALAVQELLGLARSAPGLARPR